MYLNKNNNHTTRTLYTFMKKILFCLTKIKEKNIANTAYIMNILHRQKISSTSACRSANTLKKRLKNMINC